MKKFIFKFCFHFWLQYALTITFDDLDLSFLKIILKTTLYRLLQGNIFKLFSMISNKTITHPPFLGNPCFPFLKLYLIIYLMKRKEIQKRKLNDTPCESIISIVTLFLKNRSNQKIYKFCAVNDEVHEVHVSKIIIGILAHVFGGIVSI